MVGIRTKLMVVAAMLALSATAALGASKDSQRAVTPERIRKELVTLPYYGVFDNISFSFDGDTVTLSGKVVRPTTRSDAARRVAKLRGVERVVNNIEVLPLSSFDNSLRARAYNQIFRTG